MITDTFKTPRLLAAAKEFNIGKETLVTFLADNDFVVDHKTSARLTSLMYDALQSGFAQHKKIKCNSEELVLAINADSCQKLNEIPVIPGMHDRYSPYHVI